MAKLRRRGDTLTVELNLIEKIAALRGNVMIPYSAITTVTIIDRPLTRGGVLADLKMGFAAGGAPLQTLATVGAWNLRNESGKALVVVYRNRPSIRIGLDHTAEPWRRIVISARRPATELANLRPELLKWDSTEWSLDGS